MQNLIASVVAVAFLSVSGFTLAADKADEKKAGKKADKPAAGAAKDAKTKSKKKKKEGC